jgi:cobaltochelatase CobS
MRKSTSNPAESVISVKDVFGFDCNRKVVRLSDAFVASYGDDIPKVDPSYVFDPTVTRAILAGFQYNSRVLVQGYHGTGKTSHIEQVAARLNYPCIRINLDEHISRSDLIGRDAIVLKDGKQVTEFAEGILPHVMQRPYVLILDEYDAGRAEVMFAFQRVLEADGKLTLLGQNRVVTPCQNFRIFATANTVGLGDAEGLYAGTQRVNQGQMDRWNMVVKLNYLDPDVEKRIVIGHHANFLTKHAMPQGDALVNPRMIGNMVTMAGHTRKLFRKGEISTVMSPRTVIMWAENTEILGDVTAAFKATFLNKGVEDEYPKLAAPYQQTIGQQLIS